MKEPRAGSPGHPRRARTTGSRRSRLAAAGGLALALAAAHPRALAGTPHEPPPGAPQEAPSGARPEVTAAPPGAATRLGGHRELQVTLGSRIAEELRSRVESSGDPPRIPIGTGEARAGQALKVFYERRRFRPAWSGSGGPSRLADDLVATLGLAYQEGLDPADYRLTEIERVLAETRRAEARGEALRPASLADLDLLLSDAFLVYGSHLLAGRINPETIDPEWIANRRGADLSAVLDTALLTGRIDGTLTALLPPQTGYWTLREALARYRGIADAGGWPEVPEGPALRAGDRDERVAPLRLRLEASGELAAGDAADPGLFDAEVESAVRRFQVRHGLEVDGVVGADTREALRVPVERRVHQIELNMERFRWLPQDLGSRHILVNIAAYRLELVENARAAMDMKVVVGQRYRRTPVFSGRMTYLVLNPYWEVPHDLAVKDKLPLIRQDPLYLARQGIRVFRGWGPEAVEIDPASVDWASLSAGNFPFRLRQDPGPENALGRVKLMFPNRFDVYLHDTPQRELFERARRDFSSGCIRLEKPIELAIQLLVDDPRWTREAIEAALAAGRERTIPLPRPIPVHLLYWTTWADDDGTIHFRRDVYGRDGPLDLALHRELPAGESRRATPAH